MEVDTVTGRWRRGGFTLIELLVVLLLLGLLSSLSAPMIAASIHQAKESALKENLRVMRKALDDFYADHGAYPERLEQLMEQRYLRITPKDPIGESPPDWQLIKTSAGTIFDVRSASLSQARDGTFYNDW